MAPTKNNKPTRVSAVLFNHRLAALSPSQRRKGVSWLVRNGVDVAQFKSARQVLAAQNALVSFVNNCSTRTNKKHLRELVAAKEEADPDVFVVVQDEAAALKEQLKVAKAQYTTWANETEADHAKEVASLKDEVKTLISDVEVLVNRVAAEKRDRIIAEKTHKVVYRMYEEKCNLISLMGKNRDTHVKWLNDRVEGVKMMQVEMDALKVSLTAEKNKNKELVDSLERMLVVVEPQPIRVNSPINVFDVFEPTCVRCKNPVATHAGTVCT